MSKRILLLGLVCCAAVAGLAFAEAEFDAEAARNMSKAERLAYQQAYKADLEAAALANGWVPGERRDFEPSGRQVQGGNKAVGSMESRVLSSARKFNELGVSSDKSIQELVQVESAPRDVESPELLPDQAETDK